MSADSRQVSRPAQALLDRLADVTGWRDAETMGTLIARALPGVVVVEFTAVVEMGAANSWQTGIAWHHPADLAPLPRRIWHTADPDPSEHPAPHGWCALATTSNVNDDAMDEVVFWDESAAEWWMRVARLTDAVERELHGPFAHPLDLAEAVLKECQGQSCDIWWRDADDNVHPMSALVAADDQAEHDLCDHIRAIAASVLAAPESDRPAMLTALSLNDPPRLQAVQFLLTKSPLTHQF